ncbi:transcriptional regulator MraZ [Lachnospiraceae bacterium]|nr:transcriptional regulator MraZ [Lachnospiraceae bacterium]
MARSGGDLMFIGEYNHVIDAKGRLIIPAKFRETLGDNFVVTKGLDGCLFVYDNTEWSAFEDRLKTLPLINKEARKFVRFFLAGAASVEVDKQGRILIPSVLREFAALDKEVVLAGVGGRIEIWSKARWKETSEYDDMEEIAEHMSEFGQMI